MKTYVISKKPEVLDWNEIPALYMDTCLWNSPGQVEPKAQLCYDEEALYVRLSTKEANIRAEETGKYGMPCLDSCLEFFFCPMEGDIRYFNIESNPNGAMFLGFGPSVQELCRLIQEEPVIAPRASYTEDGWKVEYEVPHSFVRRFFPDYPPAPGKSILANCYKCSGLSATPHWLCWCPVVEQPCAFHNPSCFGTMYFE